MKRLSILLMLLFLTGCAASPIETSEPTLPTPMTEAPQPDPTETTVPATTTPPDPIQELLDSMTIEERVGQLFLARCNAESALTDIQAYHLGGFVLFGEDFDGQTPGTLRQALSGYQAAASIPLLLAVDEEGGTVTRISRYPAFRKNWKAAICSPSPPESRQAVVRCWSATTSFRHWTETPPPPSPPRSINISGTPWALTAWS